MHETQQLAAKLAAVAELCHELRTDTPPHDPPTLISQAAVYHYSRGRLETWAWFENRLKKIEEAVRAALDAARGK